MHLTVTSRPALSLEIGERNLKNFINSGYDHIHVTPNENYEKIKQIRFYSYGFSILWVAINLLSNC